MHSYYLELKSKNTGSTLYITLTKGLKRIYNLLEPCSNKKMYFLTYKIIFPTIIIIIIIVKSTFFLNLLN